MTALPEYTVLRTNRKTMALEVTREAAVLVRAPRCAPASAISAFVQKNAAWIETHVAERRERMKELPQSADEAALRKRAREELPPRVEHYAAIMGVRPAGISITSARKRFGSCSGKNRLCFSLFLMQYPPEAIDYVVVHELAHIRYKNHGREFYAFVENILPDHRARRALLK